LDERANLASQLYAKPDFFNSYLTSLLTKPKLLVIRRLSVFGHKEEKRGEERNKRTQEWGTRVFNWLGFERNYLKLILKT